MIDWKENTGGRPRKWADHAGDCVCRALAILTGRWYCYIWLELATINKSLGRRQSADHGVRVGEDTFRYYIEEQGFKEVYNCNKHAGPKPTLTQAGALYGDCLVSSTNKHMLAIKDGVVQDAYDSRTSRTGRVQRKARRIWILEADD